MSKEENTNINGEEKFDEIYDDIHSDFRVMMHSHFIGSKTAGEVVEKCKPEIKKLFNMSKEENKPTSIEEIVDRAINENKMLNPIWVKTALQKTKKAD